MIYVTCRQNVPCNTLKQVKVHYDQNKDFVVLSDVSRNLMGGGKYVSKSTQAIFNSLENGMKLEVRYGKNLEKLTVL